MKLHGKALALLLAASMILGTATTAMAEGTEEAGDTTSNPTVTDTLTEGGTTGGDGEETETPAPETPSTPDTTPTSAEVSTAADLKKAVEDGTANITLTADIELSETLIVTKALNLNGNGKKLTFNFGEDATSTRNDPKHGIQMVAVADDVSIHDITIDGTVGFGVQAYRSTSVALANVTIKNAKKGGLLVNGSTVTVRGLTVDGDAWGGVEVSRGEDVQEKSTLIVEDTITYTPHKKDDGTFTPVIWIDGRADTTKYEVKLPNGTELTAKTVGNQVFYVSPMVVDTKEKLKEAINAGESVRLDKDLELDEMLIINKGLTIDGNSHKLTFNFGEDAVSTKEDPKHGIQMVSGDVSINNITIVNTVGFGVHAYLSNVNMTNVTIENAKKGGLLVNGSNVTATDLTLSGNKWGGIEVSKGVDVAEVPELTLTNDIKYTASKNEDGEDTPVIWADKMKLTDYGTNFKVNFPAGNTLTAVEKGNQVFFVPVENAVNEALKDIEELDPKELTTEEKATVTTTVETIQKMDNEALATLEPETLAKAEELYLAATEMTVKVPDDVKEVAGLALAVPVTDAKKDAVITLAVESKREDEVENKLENVEDFTFAAALDIKVQLTKGDSTTDVTVQVPVTVTMKLPAGISEYNSLGQQLKLLHIHNSVVEEIKNLVIGDGTFTFTTPTFSTFVLGYGDDIVITPKAPRARLISESERKTYQLWNDIQGQINAAEDGTTITVQAASWVRYLPSRVMVALTKHPGVTLKVVRSDETYVIEKALPIEPNRVYYPFETLKTMLAEQAAAEAAAQAAAEAAVQDAVTTETQTASK